MKLASAILHQVEFNWESDAQHVARFNNGLRYDIQAIVSLQTTWTIDEAVRIALKAEQTIKKQGTGSSMYKTKTDTNQSKAHSESEDEGLIISPNAVFEDDDDHSEAFLGLVPRLVLASTKKSEDSQRHNIFQTRCKINQEVFNVIVDGGSSENIISRDIVTRLKLTPKKHPKPYKIGWIKAVGEVRVTEQCEVLFAMGKYKDTVLFDIVDMDCHVLLGRPWQSDMNVVHKGKENTYTFSKEGRKFTLCPYSDEVQAITNKEKKNQIMLCSTRNKDKNIRATTITPDKVLNPIMNSWSSSFQEGENDGGPELEKKEKG
ncbi:putative receptor protein kinase ZmPK1 [Tanacetum coccineum]